MQVLSWRPQYVQAALFGQGDGAEFPDLRRTLFRVDASRQGPAAPHAARPDESHPPRRAIACQTRRPRVRCCSASNNRTFSIAITAWSANVVASSICLFVNGVGVVLFMTITPTQAPSRSKGTPSIAR